MPRKSKLRRRSSGWNEDHIRILQGLPDWFELFRDAIDMHAAWTALRSEIMGAWIKEHPGTRPYAWWMFDMPQGSRRECINGRHPHDDPRYDLRKELWYGMPRCQRMCDLLRLYESEASFLRRLNLCSAAELSAFLGKTEQ